MPETGGAGCGKNWLAGQDSDFEVFQAGLTWHPSGRLRSNALYVRYFLANSEQGIADESEVVHTLRYESRQVRVGILGRDHLWKRLGYFWNAGLGFKAGPSRTEWIGDVPKDGKSIAAITRLAGYLDLGFGLSWEI